MADIHAPERPIWTPGAWLAGFIKGTTRQCYTQNIKALGYVASEKKRFFMFSHRKYLGANDPWVDPFFTTGA